MTINSRSLNPVSVGFDPGELEPKYEQSLFVKDIPAKVRKIFPSV